MEKTLLQIIPGEQLAKLTVTYLLLLIYKLIFTEKTQKINNHSVSSIILLEPN